MDYVAGHGKAVVIWDEVVKGLRIRVGRRVASWQYYHEQMEHRHRFIKCETLGHFERGTFATFIRQGNEPQIYRSPAHLSTNDARHAAEILRGKILEGVAPSSKRSALTVADAMNGYIKPGSGEREMGYIEYLESKAKDAGKPPRWAEKVRSLYKVLFEPSINGRVPMAKRTLLELSDDPSIAEDWHRDCKKESGPTSANRASQVLRAMYSRTARRGGKKLGLSKVDIPTASVEMHKEKKVQKGLDPAKDLSSWYKKWQQIPCPVKRAYHTICLLTGARRGELSRVQWDYLSEDVKAFTLLRTKTENGIIVPVTPQIAAALALARDALTNTDADGKPIPPKGTDLMFPGCFNNPSRDGIAYGHALRRTYKTIATGWCHVPDDISAVLLGHAPEGMSPKYRLRWTQQNWPAVIEAQHKISAEIERLMQAEDIQKAA